MENQLMIPNNNMTSLQIKELTGIRHDNVMRDIRDEIEKLETGGIGGQLKFEESYYTNSQNKKQPMYILTPSGVMQLAARYDAIVRAKLIDAVMEKQSTPKLPSNYKEALLQLVAVEEEKERLQLQLTEAERTKSWINNKKTATSMSRAGVLQKQVNKLTDNEKKSSEFTPEEVAAMFGIFSVKNLPHGRLVGAFAKTLDNQYLYMRTVKVKLPASNSFYDQVYFNQKFVTVLAGYLEQIDHTLGYLMINNRRWNYMMK